MSTWIGLQLKHPVVNRDETIFNLQVNITAKETGWVYIMHQVINAYNMCYEVKIIYLIFKYKLLKCNAIVCGTA